MVVQNCTYLWDATVKNSSVDLFNLTNKEIQDIIESVDGQFRYFTLPCLVLITLTAIFGLIGNIMVLYVYHRNIKPSVTRCFILSLAWVDLFTCLLSIPGEFSVVYRYYTFTDDALCKIIKFVESFTAMASATFIVTMTVDRFMKICRPFQPQMSMRHASIAVIIGVIVSVFVASLFAVVCGRRRLLTSCQGILGIKCSYPSDQYYLTVFSTIFGGLIIVIVIILLGTVVVLYSMISVTLWRLNRTQSMSVGDNQGHADKDQLHLQYRDSSSSSCAILPPSPKSNCCPFPSKRSRNTKTRSTTSDIISGSSHNSDVGNQDPDDLSQTIACDSNQTTIEMTQQDNQRRSRELAFSKNGGRFLGNQEVKHNTLSRDQQNPSNITSSFTKKELRITLIVFSIAVIFAVTYVPYVVVAVMRSQNEDFIETSGTPVTHILIILLRSYFINVAVNPFIYSFLNAKFRHECLRLFRRST